MNLNKRNFWISAALILAAALALRLALFSVGVKNIPAFDDECKISLQSMQIARGDRPLTILASPYIFPLDAYLMAPFISFLPRDAFGARIMALCCGVLTVLLSLLILKRCGTLKESWPGWALVLFPSAYLLILQVGCALPGYTTMMVLGALTIWLALRHDEAVRHSWIPALLAGLAGGLAASDTLLSLPFLLMSAAMVASSRRWQGIFVSAPVFGLGALTGFAPHLIATHMDKGAFSAVQQSVSIQAGLRKILSPVLDYTLPSAFGWGPTIFPDSKVRVAWPTGMDLYVGLLIMALLLVFTAVIAWNFIKRWRQDRWPKLNVSVVFLGISWMCFALFLFSARSHSHTYRYFIPLVWSFPFLVACIYRSAPIKAKFVIGAFTVALIVMNVVASGLLIKRWADPGFADYLKSYDLRPTFAYLNERGITRCYGTYADAYRITYESDEKIICAQPYNERFPGWKVPFKDVVDASTNVAFVLSDTYKFFPSRLERDMSIMQVTAKRTTCGRYEVYTDFQSAIPPPGPGISPSAFSVTMSHNSTNTLLMHDGNLRTHWRSHMDQKKGMQAEISLSEAAPVSQIKIYYNRYRGDRPRAMRLQALANGEWQTLLEPISRSLEEFEFINGHPVYGNEVQVIRFPPTVTQRLRFEIIDEEPKRDWTIAEIQLFTAADQK